jgi:hypothetical protein
VSDVLGEVEQVGVRRGQVVQVSRHLGPGGAPHVQLTSPGDVVQLDYDGARRLWDTLGGWLDPAGGAIIGQGRVDILERIVKMVRRDGRHAGPYLADWISVALHGDATALRELDRRMAERRS